MRSIAGVAIEDYPQIPSDLYSPRTTTQLRDLMTLGITQSSGEYTVFIPCFPS